MCCADHSCVSLCWYVQCVESYDSQLFAYVYLHVILHLILF
jgi:hypothetical protein